MKPSLCKWTLAAASVAALPAFGQISDGVVRLGCINDQSGFYVKTKAESKAPWDYYKVNSVIPAGDAFTPLSASECPLVSSAVCKVK
jgi:hypothetical protein